MNDHERMRELAALAAAGAATAAEQRELERHASGCAGCREAVDAFAAIGRGIASIPAPPAPPDLAARALARAGAARPVSARLLAALAAFSWALTAAAWLAANELLPAGLAWIWFGAWTATGWAGAAAAAWALRRNAEGRVS